MELLSRQLINIPKRPIKIVQFGEGNFLRAFVDNFIQNLNDSGLTNLGVAVVAPLKEGRIKELAAQDGLYNIILSGISEGKIIEECHLIDCLVDFINPYEDLAGFLNLAKITTVSVIISNTTEAGIVYVEEDIDFNNIKEIPHSFPAKLLLFLYTRYLHFNGDLTKTLDILPCELIDNNGDELRNILNKLLIFYRFDADFVNFVNHCRFYNSLVDRIVPGFPKDEAPTILEKLGYLDNNLVKGEIFHLWVIEGDKHLQTILPFQKTKMNVYYVDDIKPYKEQKVKILNGAHTALVPLAYLRGYRTVMTAINDPVINNFITNFLKKEVIPTIDMDEIILNNFADTVIERFKNPFIKHYLLSIALNAVSKYKARILPVILKDLQLGITPYHALFALAALTVFYRGYDLNKEVIPLSDDADFIDFFAQIWHSDSLEEIAVAVLTLPFFATAKLKVFVPLVAKYIEMLLRGEIINE